MERTSETKPVTIVAIGAGNRTNKYLEYAIRNPDRLKLVGVAELNDIRRHAVASKFGLKPEECFADYERFFENPVPADAILIGTPENMHFEPCMKAIEAGYNVLLEKPIAQSLPECCRIAEAARRKGVIVGVCHVLRYHPYFIKIKEIVDSGQLGEIISISHLAAVGLDRTTHGFVRGMWRREEITNPMLISKCCHDIDFLLWLTEARCRKLSSFGSLRWFRAENAPKGSTPRCIDCPLEKECPYSAVDLYYNRRDWISNFDVPEGATLDEVILRQLRTGGDQRETHIRLTHGEIDGDERILRVRRFRGGEEQVYDFSGILGKPFHAGADLNLVEDFVDTISRREHRFRTSIGKSVESHRICFEAERSRLSGQTVILDQTR